MRAWTQARRRVEVAWGEERQRDRGRRGRGAGRGRWESGGLSLCFLGTTLAAGSTGGGVAGTCHKQVSTLPPNLARKGGM